MPGFGLIGALKRLPWKALEALTPRRTVYPRGLTFTLQCDNWITHYRWKTYSTKEPESLDWIDRSMKDGDILFDIGANIGVYALYAALRHPRSRVITFEPEYANLHYLRDNIIANGLQNRIEVYGVALGERTGLSSLHIQDLTPGAALHTESRESLSTTKTGKAVIYREGIYTLTLDDFCKQTGISPNCLKLDVDGTEPEVLKGALHSLASSTLYSLILEPPAPETARRECEDILRAAGFEPHMREPHRNGSNMVWGRPALSAPAGSKSALSASELLGRARSGSSR